jgi:hypothetical protein
MDLDFDGTAAWLRQRLGRRVVCSVQGEGNTGLSVVGPLLQRDDGEVQLIDPPPGRVAAWSVGGATLLLLEGDLAEARAVEFPDGGPGLMQATFAGVVVTVGEVPAGASL